MYLRKQRRPGGASLTANPPLILKGEGRLPLRRERRGFRRLISMKNEVCLTSDSILQCPHCNGEHLHHIRTEVYCRADEDANYGTMLIADECSRWNHVKFESSFSNNPSTRRNGIRILFYCETCPERPILNIIQHKGSSYIVWETNNG